MHKLLTYNYLQIALCFIDKRRAHFYNEVKLPKQKDGVYRMVLESWAIIIIMVVAAYMFGRAHRKEWAFRVLPLIPAPLVNIVFSPVARRMAAHGADVGAARILVYIAAFAVTVVWVLVCARKLSPRAAKWGYVLCTLAFTAIMLIIFAVKLIHF